MISYDTIRPRRGGGWVRCLYKFALSLRSAMGRGPLPLALAKHSRGRGAIARAAPARPDA